MENMIFYPMPKAEFEKLSNDIALTRKAVEQFSITRQDDTHLTRAEFLVQAKMGETKFASVIKFLKHVRQGKTILIPRQELLKYLNGEIKI